MWSYAWTEEKFELLWGSRPMGSISAAATSVPPRLGVWAETSRGPGEVEPREPAAERQAPRQERAPIDALV